MHMKFIKEILGVHYMAANTGCRAELARLSLRSIMQTAAIIFQERKILSQDTLVNKIYSLSEQINSWVKIFKYITSA